MSSLPPSSDSKASTPPATSSPTLHPRHRQQGKVWPWLLVAAVIAGGVLIWWKTRPADGGANGGPGAAASAPGGGSGGGSGGGRRFAGGGPGGANRTQPVSVEQVREQNIRVSASAIGTITASNTAVVRAQVSGVLQSIQFKEGQQVKAGQQLAQIDPRAFQAALGQVEGALARDKASLENARVDLARYRDLAAKDAIPKQQLDTQEALLRQYEGTIKVDQAAVDSARLQLSYARVTAPISGRVGLKQADLGNVVSPGDANGIVTITQNHPIAMVFAVPSALLPQITRKLRANEPLAVEAWDRTGSTRLATGRVATLDNTIDTTTDTVKLKAIFANEDDALFPNQSVGAKLQLDVLANHLAVPSAAVQRGSQGFYIYVVNADNSVATRVVKPGPVDGDWTAIDGKVEAGEKVVIDGVDRLREGAKVEIIASDPQKRAGAATPGGRRGHGAAGAASGAASGAARGAASGAASASAEERPRWLDRLPPDVQDKVMKMSPEERQAWIEKRRAERAASGNGN